METRLSVGYPALLDDHLHVLRYLHFCGSSQGEEAIATSTSCFSAIFLANQIGGERN